MKVNKNINSNIENAKKIKNILENDYEINYRDFIIGLIAYEKGIKLTTSNYNKLNEIYNKWLDTDYNLLNECFNDNEYDMLSYNEYKFLNEGEK